MRTEHKWALVAVIVLIAAIAYIISVSGSKTQTKGELPFENRTPATANPAAPNTSGTAAPANRPTTRDRGAQDALNLNASPAQRPPGPREVRSPFLPPLTNANSATSPRPISSPTASTEDASSNLPRIGGEPASPRPVTVTRIPPSDASSTPSSITPPSANPPRDIATAPRRMDADSPNSDARPEPRSQPDPAPPVVAETPRRGLAVPPPPAPRDVPPSDTLTTLVSPGGKTGASAYTIKESDTLSRIAREHYGDDKYWRAIVQANPGLNPDRIIAGKTISLPPREEVLAGKSSTARPAAKPEGEAGASESGLVRDADNWMGSEEQRNRRGQPRLAADSASTANKPGARRDDDSKPRPQASPPRAARATYKVGSGDTLISIARNVLKNEDRWRDIWELNKDRLKSPDVLPLGFELKLPERETARADTPKQPG